MKTKLTQTLALFAAFCGLQLFTATPAQAATVTGAKWGNIVTESGKAFYTSVDGGNGYSSITLNLSKSDNLSKNDISGPGTIKITGIRILSRYETTDQTCPTVTLSQNSGATTATSSSGTKTTGVKIYNATGGSYTRTAFDLTFTSTTTFDTTADITLTFDAGKSLTVVKPKATGAYITTASAWSPVIEITGDFTSTTTGHAATASGTCNWTGLSWDPAWPTGGGATHDANLTVGSAATTLTINENETMNALAVSSVAANDLTLALGSGVTATAATYDFTGAAGKTTVNYSTGAAAVKAGSDTVLTADGAAGGYISVANGKKATVPAWYFSNRTVSSGGYLKFTGALGSKTLSTSGGIPSNGATVEIAGTAEIANSNFEAGTANTKIKSTGTVTTASGTDSIKIANNANSIFEVAGGTFTMQNRVMPGQNGKTSVVNVTGGVMTSAGDKGFWYPGGGYANGTCNLNISGGTFSAIYSPYQVTATKTISGHTSKINISGTGVFAPQNLWYNTTGQKPTTDNTSETIADSKHSVNMTGGTFSIPAGVPNWLPINVNDNATIGVQSGVSAATIRSAITIASAKTATVDVPSGATLTASGAISGAGTLAVSGAGKLSIAAGTASSNISLGDGATLDITGPSGQSTYVITSGTFTEGSGTLLLNGSSYSSQEYILKGNLLIKPVEKTVSETTTWSALWGGSKPATTAAVVLKVTANATLTIDTSETIDGLLVESSAGNKLTFASLDNLTVTGGYDFSGALGTVDLGIDGTELLAKNAVAGAPYSYWLFPGKTLLGADNIALPTMPKGYTVARETLTGYGTRFIATAPDTAKFGSVNINIAGGRDGHTPRAHYAGACVSDNASYMNLNHGAFPIVGTLWTDMDASNGTFTVTKAVDSAGASAVCNMTVVAGGIGNAYDVNTTCGDQIIYGYDDDNNNNPTTFTISGIPYAKFRVIVYRSTDSGNMQYCAVEMGVDSSHTKFYYGPTTTAAGGYTLNGSAAQVWGLSDKRDALVEGANYVVSDVFEGTGSATCYIKNTKSGGRAGVAAIQIVEVGNYVKEYTATITTAGTYDLSKLTTWTPSPFNPNPFDSIAVTVADNVTDPVTVNFDVPAIAAAKFVSAGSAALTFTGSAPTGISAYDFSGVNGAASVGFATGTAAVSAGADTTLTAQGTGALTIAAGKKATVPSWAGSALSGAGTIVYHAADAATAVAPGAFSDNFTGNIRLAQGTWTVTGNYPQQRMVTVDGANAKIVFNCSDPTGHTPPYPNLYVADGGTICFQTRDTFTRELVLTNAFVELDGARKLDLYGKTVSGTYYGAKISVYGSGTSYICGTTHGTTENAGSLCVRREDMPVWVAEGATLDVYSTWGFDYETCLAYRCVKQGPGTIIFRNAPVQTGSFTVSGGTLKMVDAGSPTTGEIALAENTALALEMATAQTVANAITGAGTVTKTGAGTVTLTGANTYSGATTVSGGTFKIADGASAGTGYYTVDSLATLHVGTNRTLTVVGASTGTIALTMTAAEKALFDDNQPVEFLSVTGSTFDGTIVAYDQSGNSYETDNVTVTAGGKITFTRKAGTRIPPFNLVDKTGDLAWTTAGWVDSTPGNPETVLAADWDNSVNANIALTSGTATLTTDRVITLGTLAVTNAGTLTVSASGVNTLTAGTLAVTNTGTLAFTGDAFSATTAIDDSASTGTTTFDFPAGAAAVAAGVDTILAGSTTGDITIGADKKLTVSGGLNQSQLTNEGTLNIVGGTLADPVVINDNSSGTAGFGTVTIQSGVVKDYATSGNKIYDISGVAGETTLILGSGQNWGMTEGTEIRNTKVIVQDKEFWFERTDAFDSTVDLQLDQALHICNGHAYTIGALSGSANIVKTGSESLTVTMDRMDSTYSGVMPAPLTVTGTHVLTLTGANTGALTVNSGASVVLSGDGTVGAATVSGNLTIAADKQTHNITLNSGAVLNVTGTPGQASYVITSGTFTPGEGSKVQLNGTDLPTADYTVVGNAIVRRKAATIDTASTTWADLWGGNPPTSGELVELTVTTPATLTIGSGAQAAALKVMSDADNKLTLAGATNLTASAYDFSAANGKVAFDYTGITTDTTLLSGTITGGENIDTTGVPSGAALIVTPDAVRLVFNAKYQKFSYGTVYSWLTTTAGTVDLAGGYSNFQEFDIASCTNKTTVYHGNTDFGGVDKGKFWHQFAYASSTPIKDVYAAPGEILRLAQGSYCTSISATYGPLAFGGIIAEPGDAAFTFVNGSDGVRSNILGDPTAVTPTFFDIGANVTFNRTGKLYLAGTLTFDIANGKTLDLNSAQTSYDLALFNTVAADVSGAFGKTTAGGTLIMKGEGKLKVATLKAEGSTLDFSNLPADRETPYISGTLQIDHDTMLVLPAALEKGTPFPLATNITGSATGPRYIRLGTGEPVEKYVTFDEGTVAYDDITFYNAKLATSGEFKDLDWTPTKPAGGFTVEDELILTNSAIATLNFTTPATAGVFKVVNAANEPLTIKVSAADMNVLEWVFTGANGKVKFDYTGLSSTTTLITGTIVGAENIDTSNVPDGYKLVVTDSGVTLTLATELMLYGYAFDGNGNKRAEASANFSPAVSGNYVASSSGQAMTVTDSGGYGSTFNLGDQDFTAVFVARSSDSANNNVYYAFGAQTKKGFALTSNGSNGTKLISWNNNSVELAQALDVAGGADAAVGFHLYAFKYVKATGKAYYSIDGADWTETASGFQWAGDKNWQLGSVHGGKPEGLHSGDAGALDEMRFYTAHLSQAQLSALTTELTGKCFTKTLTGNTSFSDITWDGGKTWTGGDSDVYVGLRVNGDTEAILTLNAAVTAKVVRVISAAGKDLKIGKNESGALSITGYDFYDALGKTTVNYQSAGTTIIPGANTVMTSIPQVAIEVKANKKLTLGWNAIGTAYAQVISGAGAVDITGQVQLSANNTFTGAMTVKDGGTLKMGQHYCLNGSNAVTVDAGGTLDANNASGTDFALTLNGGTLVNTASSEISHNARMMGSLTLTADSTVNLTTRNYGLISGSWGTTSMTLNGYKLTKQGSGKFYLVGTTVSDAGTIDVRAGELSLPNRGSYNCSFANGTIELNGGTLSIDTKTLTLKGLTVNGGTVSNGGTLTGLAVLGGTAMDFTAFTGSGTLGFADVVTVASGTTTLSSATATALSSDKTVTVAEGATLNFGTLRPACKIGQDTAGTIRLTLDSTEKAAYDAGTLAINLATDATAAGAFGGAIAMYSTDGTTQLYGAASFKDVGGTITLVVEKAADAKTPPFNLTNPTTASWTAADWKDSTTPTPLTVDSGNWGITVDANIAVDSGTPTLTLDRNIQLNALNITNAGTLAIADGDYALTAATIDDSASTGTTTLDFELNAANVTAGKDTRITGSSTGALTVGEGKKATLVDATFDSYTASNGAFFRWNNAATTAYTQTTATPIGDVNVTNAFNNATVTYNTGKYLLRVENGDSVTLKQSGNFVNAHVVMTGGNLALGGGEAFFLGGGEDTLTLLDMTGGTATFAKNNGGSKEYGDNFSVGFSYKGTYYVNIAGGTLNVPNAYIAPWERAHFTVSNGGVVMAKGLYRSNGNSAGSFTIGNGGTAVFGADGILSEGNGAEKLPITLAGGVLANYASNVVSNDAGIAVSAASVISNDYAMAVKTPVTGSGAITKKGTGTLTLASLANYTGAITIEAGTVDIGTKRGLTINGGTVDVTLTDGEVGGGAPIALFAGTATVGKIMYGGADIKSKCTVSGGTITAIAYEAKVGTTYYLSLATAIGQAAEGDTITMLKDVTTAQEIAVAQNITLEGGTNILENVTFSGAGTLVLNSGCIGIAYDAERLSITNGICRFNSTSQSSWEGHAPTGYTMQQLSAAVRGYQYEFVKSSFVPTTGEQLVPVADQNGDAGTIKLNSDWVVTATGGETEQQKQAEILNTPQNNTLMTWQNKVLGLDGDDPNAKPVVHFSQNQSEAGKIAFTLNGVAAGSGANVTFKVYSASEPGAQTWTEETKTPVASGSTAEVTLPPSGVKYYRYDVITETSK